MALKDIPHNEAVNVNYSCCFVKENNNRNPWVSYAIFLDTISVKLGEVLYEKGYFQFC